VTDEGRPGWRPGSAEAPLSPAAGVRVVLDLRPLQDPDRAPLTAIYLEQLLTALEADPLEGESLQLVLAAERADPSPRWPALPVAGRRLVPPTRLLRSGALTVDPILLRGAVLGAGWRAERGGAAGSVYHAATGALPIASGIPIVAALLDVAPWSIPTAYQPGRAARFGQRIRARLLKDAAAVVVPTRSAADEATRLLRVRRSRVEVVRLAPRDAFRFAGQADGAGRDGDPGPGDGRGRSDKRPAGGAEPLPDDDRVRLGLGARYAVYAGRHDARHDLATLLEALAVLAAERAPGGVPAEAWPPRVCVIDASPDDRAAVARAASRAGVGDAIAYAPRLPEARLAKLVAGARCQLLPLRSEAAGLVALEALAAGVPVIASAAGALPEVIGPAGILVEPGDPTRLATAIRTVWTDDGLHASLQAAAAARPEADRTWADVARETRAVWARVARHGPLL
jgi:glycosyltransferase involved in cell wall biosynthesis